MCSVTGEISHKAVLAGGQVQGRGPRSMALWGKTGRVEIARKLRTPERGDSSGVKGTRGSAAVNSVGAVCM